MFEWKTLFSGTMGVRLVKLEKGGGNVLRLTTSTPDLKNYARVRAASPGILREKLVGRGIFTEKDAEEIIIRIMSN